MLKKEKEPICENCSKPLFGRTDKRFCNDSCRNNYNRNKRSQEKIAEHENLPEILKVIKRNYQILKSTNKSLLNYNERISVPISELNAKGFNFKFITSIHKDSEELWMFCFERGYRIEGSHCIILDRPSQIQLENNNKQIKYNIDYK